jgi:hypothetical protein
MSDERNRLLSEYRTLCSLTKNCIEFEKIEQNEEHLCQFILDPTSLNLPVRVSLSDPLMKDFYRLSKDYCYLIDKTRIRLLKEKVKGRE